MFVVGPSSSAGIRDPFIAMAQQDIPANPSVFDGEDTILNGAFHFAPVQDVDIFVPALSERRSYDNANQQLLLPLISRLVLQTIGHLGAFALYICLLLIERTDLL